MMPCLALLSLKSQYVLIIKPPITAENTREREREVNDLTALAQHCHQVPKVLRVTQQFRLSRVLSVRVTRGKSSALRPCTCSVSLMQCATASGPAECCPQWVNTKEHSADPTALSFAVIWSTVEIWKQLATFLGQPELPLRLVYITTFSLLIARHNELELPN